MNEPTPLEFDRTCARLASALTAYFDGEATPAETKTAREHLRQCAECAELWQAWTNSRSLLLSAPIPAPPPGFLLRLLSVCRLASLRQPPACGRVNATRNNPTRDDNARISPEKVAALLGLADFDNYRAELPQSELPKAKLPQSTREAEPQPPAFLLDAIREATTREATTRTEEFESRAMFQPQADSFSPEFISTGSSWWRTMPRIAATYAVPALLALMMWSGTSKNETISVPLKPISSSVTKSETVLEKPVVLNKRRAARQTIVRPVSASASTEKRVVTASRVVESISSAPRTAWTARTNFVSTPVVLAGNNEAREPRSNRVAPMRRIERSAEVSPAPQHAELVSLAMAVSEEAPRRVAQPSLRHTNRVSRRVAPRLLTPVSFSPTAVRSHSSATRWERPARIERASEAPEETTETSESWNDDNEPTASVVETYRAAVAEDGDETEITS